MKTALLSALVFGACTSLALAEPLPRPGGAEDSAAGGAVVLAEAELDRITGGIGISRALVAYDPNPQTAGLLRRPNLIILDEPTGGIDVGAKFQRD